MFAKLLESQFGENAMSVLLGCTNGFISNVGSLLFCYYQMRAYIEAKERGLLPNGTGDLYEGMTPTIQPNSTVGRKHDLWDYANCYGLQFVLVLMSLLLVGGSTLLQLRALRMSNNLLGPTLGMSITIVIPCIAIPMVSQELFTVLVSGCLQIFGFLSLVLSAQIFHSKHLNEWIIHRYRQIAKSQPPRPCCCKQLMHKKRMQDFSSDDEKLDLNPEPALQFAEDYQTKEKLEI